jgi:hypothetical protein
MAKKPIATLKEYFKTGKKPTENQFADLLDSYVHLDSQPISIGWEDINLFDGVYNYENEHQTARIKKENNVVYIEGMLISHLNSSFVSFIIEKDFRPKYIQTFNCISNNGARAVQIDPSGEVLIDLLDIEWISLAGTCYLLS